MSTLEPEISISKALKLRYRFNRGEFYMVRVFLGYLIVRREHYDTEILWVDVNEWVPTSTMAFGVTIERCITETSALQKIEELNKKYPSNEPLAMHIVGDIKRMYRSFRYGCETLLHQTLNTP